MSSVTDRPADVVVIGAGVIGSSIAFELSRDGHRVVVLDKAGGVGHGSTSASSAIVRFNYSTWAGVALAWESLHAWRDWQGSPRWAGRERAGDLPAYRDAGRARRRGALRTDHRALRPRGGVLGALDRRRHLPPRPGPRSRCLRPTPTGRLGRVPRSCARRGRRALDTGRRVRRRPAARCREPRYRGRGARCPLPPSADGHRAAP